MMILSIKWLLLAICRIEAFISISSDGDGGDGDGGDGTHHRRCSNGAAAPPSAASAAAALWVAQPAPLLLPVAEWMEVKPLKKEKKGSLICTLQITVIYAY